MTSNEPPFVIAIDGTVASGKGTLARRLAAHYGFAHLDTGSLYRRVGLAALEAGIDPDDSAAATELARTLGLEPMADDRLRTSAVGAAASKVAVHPGVRAALLDYQRGFARQPGGAVLDGRDIGTVVCPGADAKFWVDARVEERARRRTVELRERGEPVTLEEMIAQLRERDARDQSRENAPARRASDAHLLDTSDLSIDEAVEIARRHIDRVRAG